MYKCINLLEACDSQEHILTVTCTLQLHQASRKSLNWIMHENSCIFSYILNVVEQQGKKGCFLVAVSLVIPA